MTREEKCLKEGAVAVYFGASGRQLFGWYYAVPSASRAVVICSPIGSESTGWHRAQRHWAQELAAAGMSSLRFDYEGTGDSVGDLTDPERVQTWTDSVCDAVDFLRDSSRAEHLFVAGVALGATLALAAAERGGVDGLILWAPFANGGAYLREGRAFTHLMSPGAMADDATMGSGIEQFGGLALTTDTVGELARLDPLASAQRLAIPMLLLPRHGESGDASLVARLTALGGEVESRAHAGYVDVFADAHESKVPHEVIQATISWIGAQFAGRRSVGAMSASDLLLAPRSLPRNELLGSDGVRERPLQLRDTSLFGILSHSTTALPRRTGIILVNSGAVHHVGPNRLYVTLARAWSALGYSVLRVDLAGIGDSPVDPDLEENLPYPQHAVRDVGNAIAALRAEGCERIVVGGLCSGAHTTFHAALSLTGLDGIILINPIVLYWKPSDPLEVSAWRLYVESRHYRQSARNWNSWLKLLQGRVSPTYVSRIVAKRTFEVLRAKWAAMRRRWQESEAASENPARDLRRITDRGTDVLILFSEGDPGHDLLTLNYAKELGQLQHRQEFHLRVIDKADHTFTSQEARRRATAILTEHLLLHHP